ncbi:fibrinogen-like protein 1 [Drosophila willistoni]|uniref:fibrinogen-like protein 1 n=1 Tax=Drosophila willistoni TaxID=7260 RepID=UPI001F07A25E|nr:fibrinogen-like protein 1 [Drosophila willistoni]
MNLPSVLLIWFLFLVYQQVNATSTMDSLLYDAVHNNLDHIIELKQLIEKHVNENIEFQRKLMDNSHESIELKAKDQQIELLTKLNEDLRNNIAKMNDFQNYTINKQKIETENAIKYHDDLKSQIQQLQKNEENYKKRLKQKSKSQSAIEENLNREIEKLKIEVSSLKNKLQESQTQSANKTKILENNFLQLNQTVKNVIESKENITKTVCKDLLWKTHAIQIIGIDHFNTLCNGDIEEACWIAIYSRFDDSLDFNRTWSDYCNGFGNIRKEFFIGLEKLYRITNSQTYELYVKIGYFNESYGFASYDHFKIGDENTKYELQSLGEFTGTASEVMNYHLHPKFSTFDEDNDLATDINCAAKYGAWWHNDCGEFQINGKWYYTQVKSVQMFIRPECQNY